MKYFLIALVIGVMEGCCSYPKPRLILRDGAVLHNATVENLTIEIENSSATVVISGCHIINKGIKVRPWLWLDSKNPSRGVK